MILLTTNNVHIIYMKLDNILVSCLASIQNYIFRFIHPCLKTLSHLNDLKISITDNDYSVR